MAVAAMETIQRTADGEPGLSKVATFPQVIEKKGK
jgi:hypothetical protein